MEVEGDLAMARHPFGNFTRMEGHNGRVLSLSVSNDGMMLASGSEDRTVRLWSTATGEQLSVPMRFDDAIMGVHFLDKLLLEPGSIYIMDKAYVSYKRLYRISQSSAFFVTRSKKNMNFRRLYSRPVVKETGLRCDQTIALNGYYVKQYYPDKLRRIHFLDPVSNNRYVFLTNNFILPAHTICDLYQSRWQIELFFKWIKQHLRIKAFFGTSENAVKTQIWIAIAIYVLVAITKKRMNLQQNLYTILQVLSLSLFDNAPLLQVLSDNDCKCEQGQPRL